MTVEAVDVFGTLISIAPWKHLLLFKLIALQIMLRVVRLLAFAEGPFGNLIELRL